MAALVFGACAPATRPGQDETVVLAARFSRFTPTAVDVAAGTTVRFVVRNADPIGHELIIGDDATHDRHERGTESHHGGQPGEISVAAGESAETTYRFTRPGRVSFGCHLPGHWAYGMRGTITVA